MADQKFRFHDPQSYLHRVEDKTYLVRPRLNPDDNWSVRNWLALNVRRIPFTPKNLKSVSELVVENLDQSFLTQPYQPENPRRGFCYVATQTVHYLMDTDRLDSWSGIDASGATHWWLKDSQSQKVVDVTVDQYVVLGMNPPHDVGRKRKWYGFRPFPQKRCLDLIHKIQPDSSFHVVDKLSDLQT